MYLMNNQLLKSYLTSVNMKKYFIDMVLIQNLATKQIKINYLSIKVNND